MYHFKVAVWNRRIQPSTNYSFNLVAGYQFLHQTEMIERKWCDLKQKWRHFILEHEWRDLEQMWFKADKKKRIVICE